MKELIGIWLIGLAISSTLAYFEDFSDTKEKVVMVSGIMVVIALIEIGVYLIIGGAK